MNKRILICTASTGQGHNTVAFSLKDELEQLGYDVAIMEPMKQKNEHLGNFIDGGYKLLATKMPKVYSGLYKVTNYEMVDVRVNRWIDNFMNGGLEDLVKTFDPALIISTHPLLVKQISEVISKGEVHSKFLSVVTDFQAHQAYICDRIDGYIVGSLPTKRDLVEKDIDPKIIYPYGIPIRKDFSKVDGVYQKSDLFTLLIMGGSMGMKAIKKALANILDMEEILRIFVVCGTNEELKEELEKLLSKYYGKKQVEIFGYGDKVNELMAISDVIVTKPGGLTVTESLTMRLPMIIPYYIPGQEEENTEVMSAEGVAMETDIAKLDETIAKLMQKPSLLEYMKENIDRLVEPHSFDDTLRLIENLIEKFNQEIHISGRS